MEQTAAPSSPHRMVNIAELPNMIRKELLPGNRGGWPNSRLAGYPRQRRHDLVLTDQGAFTCVQSVPDPSAQYLNQAENFGTMSGVSTLVMGASLILMHWRCHLAAPASLHATEEEEVDMRATSKAIETTGIIDDKQHLVLDEPLPVAGPTRVRVIILLPEETEIDEAEWLTAASASPAFEFLKDPPEDIYTLDDGRPFGDEG